MPKKICFFTLGCKVNSCETENIRQRLCADGFSEAGSIESADICVVNSCTVTAQADRKCRRLLHRIKRNNPGCKTVLTGCFPQASVCEAEKLYTAGLCDAVTGNTNISDTIEAVKQLAFTGQKSFSVAPHKPGEVFEEFENGEFGDRTRAFIKIQDGCNQFCTYCIIPYSRGRCRSREVSSVREEAVRLAGCGHKELVMVGINLCRYGEDLGGSDGGTLCLADAVEAVCSVDGAERVRLGSVEPELLTDSEIQRLAAMPNFCPHFHLSLQSGCEKTLRAMNRKYTPAQYRELVGKLRGAFPDCSVTTDIMVGFPGETDEDFLQSLEFVRSIGFARAHIFPYSVRKGTRAEKMPDQISERVKSERAAQMKEVCDASERAFLEKMIGKRVRVLFEKENCTRFHGGYSENYTHIKISRKNVEKSLRRQSFYVIIKSVEQDGDLFCMGEICD